MTQCAPVAVRLRGRWLTVKPQAERAASLAMTRTVLILAALAALISCSEKQKVLVSAPTGNWISLFNGKNLDGWTVKIAGEELNDNYRNTFRVEDGLLKTSYQQYDK